MCLHFRARHRTACALSSALATTARFAEGVRRHRTACALSPALALAFRSERNNGMALTVLSHKRVRSHAPRASPKHADEVTRLARCDCVVVDATPSAVAAKGTRCYPSRTETFRAACVPQPAFDGVRKVRKDSRRDGVTRLRLGDGDTRLAEGDACVLHCVLQKVAKVARLSYAGRDCCAGG